MSSLLLGKQATGGEIARDGFGYQDSFILLKLPEWLAQGAFAGVISEAIGDIEVCYFTLAGEQRTFLEAKNNTLSPKPFWAEMERFREVFKSADGLYTRFGFVAPEMPGKLAPMFAQLNRIRGVGAAFDAQAKLLTDAKSDFVDWVVQAGESADIAFFVLEYVDFFTFESASAESRFLGDLAVELPCFDELPTSRHKEVRSKWKELIQKSTKHRVSRREFEDAILSALSLPEHPVWLELPTHITFVKGIPSELPPKSYDLSLDISSYIGEDRGQRSAEEWKALICKADAIAGFLHASRNRKRVLINAELRMSAAVALGMVFKAAKGHLLEVLHRENIFKLHLPEQVRDSRFVIETVPGHGSEGVCVIQIGHPSRADVLNALTGLTLDALPQLYMESSQPIPDADSLNGAVLEAKKALADFRSKWQMQRIHLFIKGPSFFAMALGHRLNALGEIQLYDWVGHCYKPTVRMMV